MAEIKGMGVETAIRVPDINGYVGDSAFRYPPVKRDDDDFFPVGRLHGNATAEVEADMESKNQNAPSSGCACLCP